MFGVSYPNFTEAIHAVLAHLAEYEREGLKILLMLAIEWKAAHLGHEFAHYLEVHFIRFSTQISGNY